MSSFNELKKNLKRDQTGLKKVKCALLCDSASQLINIALKGAAFEASLNLDIYEAEYDQIDMEIFNSESELYHSLPEFVIINFSTEHLLNRYLKNDPSGHAQLADEFIEKVKQYLSNLDNLKCKIIINTLPEINDGIFGNFSSKVNSSFIFQVRKINYGLMDLAQQHSKLFLVDVALLQSLHGRNLISDPKQYINADMIYDLEFLPILAKNVVDIIASIMGYFKKCLVLDLDNTVWGGIIGDDGMEGIELGYFGSGKIYTELQLWAKQLKNRGIILAVCSKNTKHIAMEPFQNHPDMILRPEDIAVFVANWETKVDNIKYIQSILNIGMDSIVFIDDNKFEREMVKASIPELTVPDLPEDPAEYMPFLRSLNLFETASFTQEDHIRTQQYQEEAKRAMVSRSYENEHDFLKSLEMTSLVEPFSKFNIPRVAQLSQRSNQFNLRTVRYTEDEVTAIGNSEDYITLSFALKDKFGDHGLISCVILKIVDPSTVFVDTWIMSCRVLKRTMENFTLNTIAERLKEKGYKKLIGEYLPTKKNGLVKDHYQNLGFTEKGSRWELDIDNYLNLTTFIK